MVDGYNPNRRGILKLLGLGAAGLVVPGCASRRLLFDDVLSPWGVDSIADREAVREYVNFQSEPVKVYDDLGRLVSEEVITTTKGMDVGRPLVQRRLTEPTYFDVDTDSVGYRILTDVKNNGRYDNLLLVLNLNPRVAAGIETVVVIGNVLDKKGGVREGTLRLVEEGVSFFSTSGATEYEIRDSYLVGAPGGPLMNHLSDVAYHRDMSLMDLFEEEYLDSGVKEKGKPRSSPPQKKERDASKLA